MQTAKHLVPGVLACELFDLHIVIGVGIERFGIEIYLPEGVVAAARDQTGQTVVAAIIEVLIDEEGGAILPAAAALIVIPDGNFTCTALFP